MQQLVSRESGAGAVVGILLAAGRGSRYDPTGRQNKLLQILPSGDTLVAAAAKNLLAAVPAVIAVVRPNAETMASELQSLGCEVVICADANAGMAASLVTGLAHARSAAGWVIALADMPYVRPATIRALVDALACGAQIAAPTYQERRGNPVAFGCTHLQELLRLRGDEGARRLLKTFPVTEIVTNDPGIALDIDSPADLRAG